MKMKDKKKMRAMGMPAPGPLTTCPRPLADQYKRPGETRQVPIQNILATNNQARGFLKDHHEREALTGGYDYNPTVGRAHREAERSRVGRPGGSTFTKENIAGKLE